MLVTTSPLSWIHDIPIRGKGTGTGRATGGTISGTKLISGGVGDAACTHACLFLRLLNLCLHSRLRSQLITESIFTVGDEGAVRSTCRLGDEDEDGENEERWKFGWQHVTIVTIVTICDNCDHM